MATTRKEVKIGAKTYRKVTTDSGAFRIEVRVHTAYGASGHWKIVAKPSPSTLAAFN